MGQFLSTLTLVAVGCLPTLANAQCFSVYDRNDQLIFQSTQSPVDLGKPITEAVKQRFSADARMVFTPSADDCAPVDKAAEAKAHAASNAAGKS